MTTASAPRPAPISVELAIDRREGIVELIHENAALDIGHIDSRPAGGFENSRPLPRSATGIVDRAQKPRLPDYVGQRLALIESVIPERHAIRAGVEQLLANRLGDSETARGVLRIDHDEIEPPGLTQRRKSREHGLAAATPDDVAQKKQAQGAPGEIAHAQPHRILRRSWKVAAREPSRRGVHTVLNLTRIESASSALFESPSVL